MLSRRQRQPVKNQSQVKPKSKFNDYDDESIFQVVMFEEPKKKVNEVPKVIYGSEDEFEVILMDSPKKAKTIIEVPIQQKVKITEFPIKQEELISEDLSQATEATSYVDSATFHEDSEEHL